MKNLFSSYFRFVVSWFGPARRVQPEVRVSPEQLRKAVADMLADPKTRSLVMGNLLPIQGGVCNTPAGDVARTC